MRILSFNKQVRWGLLFVAVTGVLFHFVYDWSGENRLVGLFFPVNESTWEHMKLMYLPMLLWALWSEFFGKTDKDAKRIDMQYAAILIGCWLIPILFYSYRGILGFGVSWMDIATFFASELVVGWVLIKDNRQPIKQHVSGMWVRILVIIQGLAFLWFTYHPLALGICRVP